MLACNDCGSASTCFDLRAKWWQEVNDFLAAWGEPEALFGDIRPLVGWTAYGAAEHIQALRRDARRAAAGPIQDRLTVAVADALDGRKRRAVDGVLISTIAEANALITDLVAGLDHLHALVDQAHPRHEEVLDREVCDAADEERHPDFRRMQRKAFDAAAALIARARGAAP